MKVNNRFRSEDTEQDVALTPSAYWHSVLRGTLEKVLRGESLEIFPASARYVMYDNN